jgi:hypothetical protein
VPSSHMDRSFICVQERNQECIELLNAMEQSVVAFLDDMKAKLLEFIGGCAAPRHLVGLDGSVMPLLLCYTCSHALNHCRHRACRLKQDVNVYGADREAAWRQLSGITLERHMRVQLAQQHVNMLSSQAAPPGLA